MRSSGSPSDPRDSEDRLTSDNSTNIHPEPESRALLASIVESSDDAIISKDTQGIITSWNRAAERIFGYTAQEAIGRHITLISVPGREWEMTRILGRILSNERVSHYETVRLHKDGHHVLVSLTISPIHNEDGVIIGASKIARDITARKKSEQILQQTEKLAMLGRLSASIAHEINNPLEAVTNLLYLLRAYPLPSEGYDYLQMAEIELARISHIVTQTLSFHKQNSQPHPSDITKLFESALAFMRHRMHNLPVKIERRFRSTPPVSCLEGEIRQVILNLIGNALDAIQQLQAETLTDADSDKSETSTPRIILAHRPATEWQSGRRGVRITVADNGCGIPSEAMPRLFEAFFTTKGNTGNGLGLWISTEIIRRHQGQIRVRSSCLSGSHGTVFTIFLPYEEKKSASTPAISSSEKTA